MPLARLTREEWAQVIVDDCERFGYKNIQNRTNATWKNTMPYTTHLAATLMYDEHYMDDLFDGEAKHYASEDYKEDWEEHCRLALHNGHCCPHENTGEYERRVEKMINDEDERDRWARNRVDWDDLRQYVRDMASEQEGVACFLTEHPVEEVYDSVSEEWWAIEDVTDVCPGCERIIVDPNRVYDDDSYWACPHCGDEFPEGTITFFSGMRIRRYSFVGKPMQVAPWGT